jgi:hypothetical protein
MENIMLKDELTDDELHKMEDIIDHAAPDTESIQEKIDRLQSTLDKK